MTTHRLLLFAGLSACLLMSADWAHAETALDPPFITITVDEPVGTLTITNNRSVAAGYEIEAFGWEQEPNGRVLLPPTEGIRVEPTSIELPPHGRAEVRVLALVPAPSIGEAELVYRIRVSERPDRARMEAEQDFQVFSTFILPVFQRPPDAAPHGRLSSAQLVAGELRFTVYNDGTGHAYVREVRVTGEDKVGQEVFRIQRQGWYVLPQGELRFMAAVSSEDCRRSQSILIEAYALKSDAVWRASLTPEPPLCGNKDHSEFPIPGLQRLPAGPPLEEEAPPG